VNGRYAAQQYNPNFVGLFPGDVPQYVIVVKLTNARGEKGSFYSAATAAPLTKTVLQAALAARDAALDRHKLAASAGAALASHPDTSVATHSEVVLAGDSLIERMRANPRDTGRLTRDSSSTGLLRAGVSRVDSVHRATREAVSAGSVPYVVSLAQRHPASRPPEVARAIPDVHGLTLREAVRTLHGAGFHVRLARGPEGATEPSAGTVSTPGTLVRLFHEF
jgi:hypothetical protein